MKKETNPLKRRRQSLGYNQKQMSELLNITQSQYSRIENGTTDPTKYLSRLSDIFDCEPEEVFQGKILNEIEEEFLNNPSKEMSCTYHEKKPDSVYLKVEGWFTKEELERFVSFSMEGLPDGDNRNTLGRRRNSRLLNKGRLKKERR